MNGYQYGLNTSEQYPELLCLTQEQWNMIIDSWYHFGLFVGFVYGIGIILIIIIWKYPDKVVEAFGKAFNILDDQDKK